MFSLYCLLGWSERFGKCSQSTGSILQTVKDMALHDTIEMIFSKYFVVFRRRFQSQSSVVNTKLDCHTKTRNLPT